MHHRTVVVDVETTGLGRWDRIIEIAIVSVEAHCVVETWSSLVNPGRRFATGVSGISYEDVHAAPTFQELAPLVMMRIQGATFVAHNAPFDLRFLARELADAGYGSWEPQRTVDTMRMSPEPELRGLRASALAEALGFHGGGHRALGDAFSTAEVFITLDWLTAHGLAADLTPLQASRAREAS